MVCGVLIKYPQVQEKVHQEIVDVVGRDRLPSLKDLEKMPYLKATLFETLRHSPIVPLLIPHNTTVDTTRQGYNIPKYTMVIFNVAAIHNNPETWENPTEFLSLTVPGRRETICSSARREFRTIWRWSSSVYQRNAVPNNPAAVLVPALSSVQVDQPPRFSAICSRT